jgi:hypothetical protein
VRHAASTPIVSLIVYDNLTADMKSIILAALALTCAAQSLNDTHGAAMMRFACSQLTVERLDPLVNPGVVGSPHTHQIVGGNSFVPEMKPGDYDMVGKSTCTTCTFSEDFRYVIGSRQDRVPAFGNDNYEEQLTKFSNYWTAALYFRAQNGTYQRVQQYPNLGLNQRGGMTVYYIPPYDGISKVTAFKPVCSSFPPAHFPSILTSPQGFRMLAGNPLLRNTTGESRGICHRCVNKNSQPFGGAPCTEGDTTFLPTRMCEGGIRTQITFPTCWDGVNLDSPDHQSHVAYAEIPYEPYVEPFTPVEQRGKCPEGFPVMLPQVMYEVMFDTVPFNQKELWGQNGTQPFVFSMGDAYVYLD